MERDLHDGAQQKLLAVAATLARADLVADDQVREIVNDARAGLSVALRELRELARGIHPAVQPGWTARRRPLTLHLAALPNRRPWYWDMVARTSSKESSAPMVTGLPSAMTRRWWRRGQPLQRDSGSRCPGP